METTNHDHRSDRRARAGALLVAAVTLAAATTVACGSGSDAATGSEATPAVLPASPDSTPPVERVDTYCRLVAAERPTTAGDTYWADRRAVEHRALFLAPTTELREASETVAAHTRDVVVPVLDGRDGPGAVLVAAALGQPVSVTDAHRLIREWESGHCGA